MSKFLSARYDKLLPYVPGEQPKVKNLIKLNTNESPFPPSKNAVKLAKKASKNVNLYSDPEVKLLVEEYANRYGLSKDNIIFSNGSDEVLNYAFMAFCDKDKNAIFPDITYGFYSVFADINCVPYKIIPLKEDFSIDTDAFINEKGTAFIANPNAPTGIYLPLSEIEKILSANKDRVVVIDEAYIDFGEKSAVSLIDKYDNLLVTQTFSKSRSMAGARLGVGIAKKELIDDLKKMKYSLNPYNVNAMTMMMGVGSLKDDKYFKKNCAEIIKNREYLTSELKSLGFTLTDSKANFVFCKSDKIKGKTLYESLRKRGILVRYFDKPRINEYNRITVGSRSQMIALVKAITEILEEVK